MQGTLGSFPLASTTLAGDLYDPVSAPSISVTIDGVDRSDMYKPGSLRVTDRVNEVNNCRLTLIDESKTFHPSPGHEIDIKRIGHRLFRGRITTIRTRTPKTEPFNEIQLQCHDFNKLTDRFVLAVNYETDGQTLKDIILDIVNVQNGGALATEGVTTNGLDDGPEIGTVKFNYNTVHEAFDELAGQVGYLWNIDYEKNLTFIDRESYMSPIDFGLDGKFNMNDISTRSTLNEYRNIQYLRGGQEVIEPKDESFAGNGEDRTFTLNEEVGNGEDDPPVIKVNGAEKTVGIRSKSDDADYQWFWQRGDKSISQSTNETVLSSSDKLTVTYRALEPIRIEDIDETEVAARASIEGGTGIYSHVEDDNSVDDFGLAADKAQELLRRYGTVPEIVSLETFYLGLRSGMLPFIEHSGMGLSDRYMIDQVTTRDAKGGLIIHDVDALNVETRGGWATWFRNLIKKVRPVTIRENEKIVVARTSKEDVGISDSVFVDDNHSGVFILNDPYTTQESGFKNISGELVPAWVHGFARIGDHPLRDYSS